MVKDKDNGAGMGAYLLSRLELVAYSLTVRKKEKFVISRRESEHSRYIGSSNQMVAVI